MPSDNPFWDFSLTVYRKPGVAEACLRLQDGAGVDVNLLLYACWLATVRDAPLDDAELRAAVAQTDAWRDRVVRPLREVRRWMKGGADGVPAAPVESLRTAVKRAELESERLQQDMLFAIAGAVTSRPTDAGTAQRIADNIAAYLRITGVALSDSVHEDCQKLAMAANAA